MIVETVEEDEVHVVVVIGEVMVEKAVDTEVVVVVAEEGILSAEEEVTNMTEEVVAKELVVVTEVVHVAEMLVVAEVVAEVIVAKEVVLCCFAKSSVTRDIHNNITYHYNSTSHLP